MANKIPRREVEQTAVIQALYHGLTAFPHLRVGQLMENAVYTYRRDNGHIVPKDHFYIEDEEMAVALYAYIENYSRETA